MLTIVGCGNPTRRDDGVGVVVARRVAEALRARPSPSVQVFDCGTGGMDVMFRARGATRLVIVDASSTGSPPGAVFRVPGEELAREREVSFTLHDFRWEHALVAGRRIFRDAFPTEVEVFLVEAADLGLGLELTPEVAAAADRVVGDLLALVEQGRAPDDVVRFRRGSLHLDASLAARHFEGRDTVVPVVREGRLWVYPVRDAAAGGLLLKVRNARGDRVVHLGDLLAAEGLDEALEGDCAAVWDDDAAALAVTLPDGGVRRWTR